MAKIKDIAGQRFGKLTVLRLSEQRIRGGIAWECSCDCGVFKTIAAQDLTKGILKSCGCLRYSPKDITNKKRGSLTAISCTGQKSSNGDYIWNFTCDCGADVQLPIGRFNFNPHPSCVPCSRKRARAALQTHGMTNTKAYTSWRKIKERCYSPNCPDFKDYGAKGVTLQEEYLKDFLEFYAEVGDPPDDGKRWTIDRIDHTIGYEKGNMRWADDFQQARNKGKSKKNTSGVTGVLWDEKFNKDRTSSTPYAVAIWRELGPDGVMKSYKKCFSVKKLGLLEAFAYACQYREDKIKELNALGYGYSDNHGE